VKGRLKMSVNERDIRAERGTGPLDTPLRANILLQYARMLLSAGSASIPPPCHESFRPQCAMQALPMPETLAAS
jgi:hypothetical protein